MKRRVVVTGMGIISPVGNNIKSAWKNILKGKSGISYIKDFDTTSYITNFAGLVKNFNIKNYILDKYINKMDHFIQYGVAASIQAIEDSKIIIDKNNSCRLGISIGSGIGGLKIIEQNFNNIKNNKRINPYFIPSISMNIISSYVSIIYGINGPGISISTACASGIHNIGLAARMISYNDADIMIAGGAEKSSVSLAIKGFNILKVLSTNNKDPKSASRPWDKNRDGFVLGDGAGILILEEYNNAIYRKAKIYAEVAGFGMSSDAYHIVSPPLNGYGANLAMKNALKDANISIYDIGYINAHGTSTILGDIAETNAIKSIFYDYAYKLKISSTKSMTGHLLGAAGAIESIFSILSLKYQIIPPTINFIKPGKYCDLDYTPNNMYKIENLKYVLCNSFGFGGTNGTLIFKNISII